MTFPPATATGGSGPLATSCSPSSGSTFPIGTSTVTCTASDTRQLSSSCTFGVTVQAPPQIAATRFVAFGDSITEGKMSDGSIVTSTAYPSVLLTMLNARYTAQTFVVSNAGLGGETTAQGAARLRDVLRANSPEILLLLEGSNDLNQHISADVIVNNLRDMVRAARERGLLVFLGTLPPQRAGGRNTGAPEAVSPANDRIRVMASNENAVLVDIYAAFGGVAGSLIGDDGLHPDQAGYGKIAETFFASIRDRLETGSVPLMQMREPLYASHRPGRYNW